MFGRRPATIAAAPAVDDGGDDVSVVQADAESGNDLEKTGSESPVIRFVNFLIADALKQGASDIHVEPKKTRLKIRYRIDGVRFDAGPTGGGSTSASNRI